MAFRDDREALRAQRDALEEERRQLEEELEEKREALASQKEKGERARAELAELKTRLAELEPKKKKRAGPGVFIGAGMLTALLVAAVALIVLGVVEEPVPNTPMPHAVPPQVDPGLPRGVGMADRFHPMRLVHFGAAVVSAEGIDLEVGEGCVVAFYLDPGPTAREGYLTCRGALYEPASRRLAGSSPEGSSVHERAVEDGFRYSVVFENESHDGLTLSVDTPSGRARLHRPGADGVEVVLELDRFSARRVGESLVIGDVSEVDGPEQSVEADRPSRRACDLGGTWSGELITEGGIDDSLELYRGGTRSTVTIINGELVQRAHSDSGPVLEALTMEIGPAREELDCRAGTAVLTTDRGVRMVGRFGPGDQTLLGTIGGTAAGRFWLRRTRTPPTNPSEADSFELTPEQRAMIERALGQATE